MTPEIRGEMRRLVLLHLWKIETVARRFGVHHSTVKRVLRDAEVGELPPIQKSVVDDFKPRIIQRITEAPELSAVRLLEELRQCGYQHGIAVLRRYVAQVRQPRSRKVYLRVEMEPGEQAQVDWGHFGHLRIGNSQRPLSAFAMVLSYSVLEGAVHRLLARPAPRDVFADAPPRAGILRRCAEENSLRQPEVGGAAPRRQHHPIQPALPRLRRPLPLRADRRPCALPGSEGTRRRGHQVPAPFFSVSVAI